MLNPRAQAIAALILVTAALTGCSQDRSYKGATPPGPQAPGKQPMPNTGQPVAPAGTTGAIAPAEPSLLPNAAAIVQNDPNEPSHLIDLAGVAGKLELIPMKLLSKLVGKKIDRTQSGNAMGSCTLSSRSADNKLPPAPVVIAYVELRQEKGQSTAHLVDQSQLLALDCTKKSDEPLRVIDLDDIVEGSLRLHLNSSH